MTNATMEGPRPGEEPAKDGTEVVIKKTIERIFNDTIAAALKDPLAEALNATSGERGPQFLTSFILATEFVDGDGDVCLRIIDGTPARWRTAGLLKALEEWGELGHAVTFGWSAIDAQEDDE